MNAFFIFGPAGPVGPAGADTSTIPSSLCKEQYIPLDSPFILHLWTFTPV
jgi:hypothetical protein